MTDYQRIAKAGVLALIAVVLFVPVLVGLNSLGIVNEDHCRDAEGSEMFYTLYDVSGGMELEAGTGDEAGRCVLPRYLTADGWELPGGKRIDLTATTPTALDLDNLLLPENYRWVPGGYDIAADSIAGRLLPILVPFMALMFLLSGFATAWRQFNSSE